MQLNKAGKTIKSTLLSIILLLAAAVFQTCGTAHHFTPYMPLEKGQWQLSFVWHHDLNGLQPPKVLPEINAYLGVGNDTNLGFGTTSLPVYVSHLTLAKYGTMINNHRWAYAIHINRPLSPHRNPFFEAEAIYIDDSRTSKSMISLGLAYGHGYNRLGVYPNKVLNPLSYSRIIPVFRYSYTGSSIGISYTHYHGLAQSALSPYKDGALNFNDTFVVLNSNNIDIAKSRFDPSYIIISMKDGNTINLIHMLPRYPDSFSEPEQDLQFWLGDDYKVYFIVNQSIPDKWKYYGIILNAQELKGEFESKETVAITRFPLSLVKKIVKTTSWKHDHSFGFAIFENPK